MNFRDEENELAGPQETASKEERKFWLFAAIGAIISGFVGATFSSLEYVKAVTPWGHGIASIAY